MQLQFSQSWETMCLPKQTILYKLHLTRKRNWCVLGIDPLALHRPGVVFWAKYWVILDCYMAEKVTLGHKYLNFQPLILYPSLKLQEKKDPKWVPQEANKMVWDWNSCAASSWVCSAWKKTGFGRTYQLSSTLLRWWSQVLYSAARKVKRQWAQTEELMFRRHEAEKKILSSWRWSSSGQGCPERLHIHQLQRCPRLIAAWCNHSWRLY